MIRLLKSSAGSGKTFNLAKTYIEMLLEGADSFSYRNVLAVTFTNKATAEMKGRILKELSILSDDPSASDYIEDFRKKFGNDALIKKKARSLLVNILHDYGSFSVSTIDKFFQRTLKAFAREVGQYASYQVELDKASLVHESVDRVLSSINEQDDNGKALLGWLSDSVMEGIEDTGKFNLERQLYKSANSLLSEEHREVVESNNIDEDKAYSKENIALLRKRLSGMIRSFRSDLQKAARGVAAVFDAAGVGLNQTYKSTFKSPITKLSDTSKGIKRPSNTFFEIGPDPEKWFKKDKEHDRLVGLTSAALPHVEKIIDLFDNHFTEYNNAKALYSGLHGMGILSEIRQQFQDLMKEKNVLSIDDSNVLLRKIIGEDDAPFIYEKLGVTLEHFLLDEFQDTSLVQWQNFLPLLKESEANSDPGKRTNLIVGDVKQSIYRFRGSDWKLLDHYVKDSFPSADDSDPLKQNWRSLKEVVTFNNRFFRFAAGVIDRKFGAGDKVKRIYSDVEQEVKSRDKAPGSVRATYCADKESERATVLASIDNARKRGAKWSDIAILVRGNKTGSDLASLLVSNNIPVVSDDSLLVSSCLAVRKLVSLLSLILDPDLKIGQYMTKEMGITLPSSWYSLVDLSEDLLRKMRKSDPSMFEGTVPYIMAFMDDLQEWTAANGNNLREYLNHWDESELKIASPADSDAVRIITVHKAKGLEFPYVIVPMAENVELSKSDTKWSVPDSDSTLMDGIEKAAFPIRLSDSSVGTMFEDDYRNELFLQYVDNMNIFYVALTRAGKELHVISNKPSEKCRNAVVSFIPADGADVLDGQFPTEVANFSQVLYLFLKGGFDGCHPVTSVLDEWLSAEDKDGTLPEEDPDSSPAVYEEFYIGEPYDYNKMKREAKDYIPVEAGYPSYPVSGEEGVKEEESEEDAEKGKDNVASMGRLRFRSDAADFFKIGSDPGIGSSPRLRGIVLHDILSRVSVPSDLKPSIDEALLAGDLDSEDAQEYFNMLSSLLKSVSGKGWFPTDRSNVSNESSIISIKGDTYRPDRVVKDGNTLKVIDYKFVEDIEASRASSEWKYIKQVGGYMSLYRQMGWPDVKGAIWYISLSQKGVSHVTDIL